MSEDRLAIGVIGAGRWGPNLVSAFAADPRVSEVCVIDRDRDRLRVLESHWHGAPISVSDDPATILASPEIDAIVVATPTTTHADFVRQALVAGKHVLVEKPLCTDPAEAAALCQLAEDRKRLLMVGHVFLFNPGIQAAGEALARGELGRLFYIEAKRTNLGPVRHDVNAAWDLAAHDIAVTNSWLGGPPHAVSATGAAYLRRGTEDVVFATLFYPDDVLVHLHVGWLHPRKERTIVLVGSDRMLCFDDMNPAAPVRIFDSGVSVDDGHAGEEFADSLAGFRATIRQGAITEPALRSVEPLRAECAHFISAIRGEVPLRSSGRDAVAVVDVLKSMAQSLAAGGATIPLGPNPPAHAKAARTGSKVGS